MRGKSWRRCKENHGVDARKITGNSIPLRDEVFRFAPYIMTAPDIVEKGSMDTIGRESLRFKKKLSNGYEEHQIKHCERKLDAINHVCLFGPSG